MKNENKCLRLCVGEERERERVSREMENEKGKLE
jgi:hypothetical protein